MRSITDCFERTMYRIELLNVDPKTYASHIRGYKGRAILLETLLLLQSIILLPFQIVCKPFAYVGYKICPHSCANFYNLFPKSLIKAVIKIISLQVVLIITSVVSWFNTHLTFKIHCAFGLIDIKKQQALVTKWYQKQETAQRLKQKMVSLESVFRNRKFDKDHLWVRNDRWLTLERQCNALTKQIFKTRHAYFQCQRKMQMLKDRIKDYLRHPDVEMPNIAYTKSDLDYSEEAVAVILAFRALQIVNRKK